MRLEDYDDTEQPYEMDDWYRLWDDLTNGYYFTTLPNGKQLKREVPYWWKLNYEQLFSLPSHFGMLVKGANKFQLNYIRILSSKYNGEVKLTEQGIEISLPDNDIV